jgi:serine protease Do
MAQMAIAYSTRPGWRRGATILVGTAASLAIAIGAALLASTGATPATSTLTTMSVRAAVTPCCTLTTTATRDAEAAVVSLEPASAHSVRTIGCGVVVGDGLVATTERALRGARRVRIVSATGRSLDAAIVATDPASGIALLRTSGTLPATPAVSGSGGVPGSSALAITMRAARKGAVPRPVWTSGTIVAVGMPAPGNAGPDMGQITVRGSSLPAIQGEPLVDTHGHVLGILDGAQGTTRWFLPMSLVTGVSLDLETMGKVRHGWLGVTDTTAPSGPGAQILSVVPHGAAAGVLHPGDVIVRVDGIRTTSSAQLRSMLYVMAPGTKVSLELQRNGHRRTVVVQLQPSP